MESNLESTIDEVSFSIERTNKLRSSLGLKPLKLDDEIASGSTIDQDKKAFENYSRLEHSRLDEKRKSAAALRLEKARLRLQEEKRKHGKRITDEKEEISTEEWIKKSRKLEKQLEEQEDVFSSLKYQPEESIGLHVAHDLSQIKSDQDVVLVIADGNVLDEQEDKLENIELTEQEKQRKKDLAKKQQKDFEPLLGKYDIQESTQGFKISQSPVQEIARNDDRDDEMQVVEINKATNDYSEFKKKRKTRNKSFRVKVLDEAPEMSPIDRSQEEDVSFIDDDDLRLSLARERLKNRQQQVGIDLHNKYDNSDTENIDGVVIDSTSEFASTIIMQPNEDLYIIKKEEQLEQQLENKETEPFYKNSIVNTSSIFGQDQLLVSQGVGHAVSLLKQKGVLENDTVDHASSLERQKWLANMRKIRADINIQRKTQKDLDRSSKKLDKMSHKDREMYYKRENEKWERKEMELMMKAYKNYKPQVKLEYVDEFGNQMDTKEAYKKLAHQFHGKGSGKMKTEKRLKKIEEKKKVEQTPIFQQDDSD